MTEKEYTCYWSAQGVLGQAKMEIVKQEAIPSARGFIRVYGQNMGDSTWVGDPEELWAKLLHHCCSSVQGTWRLCVWLRCSVPTHLSFAPSTEVCLWPGHLSSALCPLCSAQGSREAAH